MSVANLLFIAENWNTDNIERKATRWAFQKDDINKVVVNEAIDRSLIEGMWIIH